MLAPALGSGGRGTSVSLKPDWLIQQVPANWGIEKESKNDELEGMPASVAELLPSIEESLPQTKMNLGPGR